MAQQLPLQFKEKLLELAHLQSVLCLLDWDKLVNVPKEGQEARTATFTYNHLNFITNLKKRMAPPLTRTGPRPKD